MLKKINFIIVVLLIGLISKAQTPEIFNYQAVVRDASGELISSQNVGIRISVLQGSETGNPVYSEIHTVQTSTNGSISLKIGEGDSPTADFSAIDWGASDYYLKVEMDETGGASYTSLGASQLLSVPYALHAKAATSLGDDKVYSTASDTLFVVKDHDGNVVFAVFPDGAEVIVNEISKGKIGGFAVSGRNPTKADMNILTVTPDSTRIFVNETSKGKIGGFAVSGRNPTKAGEIEYFVINQDSARIYIPEGGTKGKIGGFAVSGRNPTKLGSNDFFNISANAAAEVINNESRIMWYPEKSALLAGELNVPSPDSVGQYSMSLGYRNKAIGQWSQAMGYQSVARGPYSTAIGYETVADTNSFAFGTGSQALGYNSFAFGSVAVDSTGNPTGDNTMATGDYSFAFGLGSVSSGTGAFALGTNCDAIGNFSSVLGFESEATGWSATAMGSKNIASGNYSLAIGALNESQGAASVAFGLGNTAEGLQSMVAGKGNIASGESSVAFGSNNMAIGDRSFTAGYGNNSTMVCATAIGQNNQASGDYSFAIGYQTTASGSRAFSSGDSTNAGGDYSAAFGYYTNATNTESFALGFRTTASGRGAISSGWESRAIGNFSTSLGYRTEAPAYATFVIGRYNYDWSPAAPSKNTTDWIGTDPLFVIGNGTGVAPSGYTDTYNDALIIYKNGNTKLEGHFYPGHDNVYDLGLSGNRWDDIYATSGTVNTSDKRLKKDIKNINYGLSEVLKLRPVTFLWKDRPEKGTKLGLIAQEVRSLIKEVVDIGDDENKTLGLRYSDLIPVLIRSIQEQQAIIEQEKEKNLKLEKQVEEINKKLKEIEELIKK